MSRFALLSVGLLVGCGGGGGDVPGTDDPPAPFEPGTFPMDPPPEDDPGDVLLHSAPAACGDPVDTTEAEPPNEDPSFDPQADEGTFAVIFVDYPIENPPDADTNMVPEFVLIPQGEDAYAIIPGASLVLRQPDGEERVLVDCSEDPCSVMDPSLSFDGQWVYYSHFEDARQRANPSYLYKMRIAGEAPLFEPIRLTYDDGFESTLYTGNDDEEDDLGSVAGIRDMAPVQLPDGRIAFTSNRAALIAFHPEIYTDKSRPATHSALQQIYIMDDHDGSLDTAELANMQRIDFGNLHLVQHPMVLKDGRLLFSSWHDAATKDTYSMTTLFAMNPDGTGLAQITEPHALTTEIEHFATQLPDDRVVTAFYYPSFDYGFGVLARFPIDPAGPDFTFEPTDQCYPYNGYPVSLRHFDRVGFEVITTHTFPDDSPAPSSSGKYSMPSIAPGGRLLTAYSTGDVNFFESHGGAAPLASGVYLVEDPSREATGDACEMEPSGAAIEEPSDLIRIVDSLESNEIWPRAVASYRRMFGVDRPRHIGHVPETEPADERLHPDMPVALLGTSSMLNRESHNATEPFDPFTPDIERAQGFPNWRVYGSEAGVLDDNDIVAVRVIMIVPRPYTEILDENNEATSVDFNEIRRFLYDEQISAVAERYASMMGERWEILGEFPVRKPDTMDPAGDVDTSWLARVPADTPLLVQSLDERGMTVVSELTWRGLRPGEMRADCGGCHAHSIDSVAFSDTAAGRGELIDYAEGIGSSDSMVIGGVWDLVDHRPVFVPQGDGELRVIDSASAPLDVEFYRDIDPILQARCVSCHNEDNMAEGLYLDGDDEDDAYARLTWNEEGTYVRPQMSRYLRAPQARQSLLVWVAYGERLDGRSNGDREDDVDYPTSHPAITGLTYAERLTIARWVDLGAPVDFPGYDAFRYTDDNLLPVIQVSTPRRGDNSADCAALRFGVLDVESGVDLTSVEAEWYLASDAAGTAHEIDVGEPDAAGAYSADLSDLPRDEQVVIRVRATDEAGNRQVSTRRVRLLSE